MCLKKWQPKAPKITSLKEAQEKTEYSDECDGVYHLV